MLLGYMRVSTTDERQSVDLQRDALRTIGVDERHFYQDHACGGSPDRDDSVIAFWGRICVFDLKIINHKSY